MLIEWSVKTWEMEEWGKVRMERERERERGGREGREGGREESFTIKLYIISSITLTERPCST